MGTRESILAALATRLATATDVVTVKRSLLSEFELRRYTRSQLPLVVVVEPDEPAYQYSGSRHAVSSVDVDIQLWLEQWDWDGAGPTRINGILDALINRIHSDITNGGYSFDTRVNAVSWLQRNTHPVYGIRLKIRSSWYQDDRVR